MKKTHTNKEIAKSAFESINDLMGEIHAGRMVGYMAVKKPELFQTKHPEYIMRMGIGAIMIALYKFEDLWEHQIKHLLGEELAPGRVDPLADHHERPVEADHDLFGRGADESLLKAQGFNTDMELFLWTKGVVESLEKVRDSLQVLYKI